MLRSPLQKKRERAIKLKVRLIEKEKAMKDTCNLLAENRFMPVRIIKCFSGNYIFDMRAMKIYILNNFHWSNIFEKLGNI